MISEQNLQLLKNKGITPAELEHQLMQFRDGFPFMVLDRAATLGDGILSFSKAQQEELIKKYDNALARGVEVTKFVPASGAASRMFKDLFEFIDSDKSNSELPKAITEFNEGKEKFAFWNDLYAIAKSKGVEDDIKEIIRLLLVKEGLNYGNSPKGVLKFHKYGSIENTAVAEHLAEGALYAKRDSKTVHIHFTVSPEHLELFKTAVNNCKTELEKCFGISYNITFSFQKPSTDTVAATLDNKPFLKENGELLFRPSGHGALIENLNDLDSDIIFIKNIDNVVINHLLGETIRNKKMIGGLLIEIQSDIFATLKSLDYEALDEQKLNTILEQFDQKWKGVLPTHLSSLSSIDKRNAAKLALSKPLRVCGMVKNEGEAGGGPFWCKATDGSVSLQIVESSQVDAKNTQQLSLLKTSTHFNPVDLVVATKNYKGEKYALQDFVDHKAGFISEKSQNGKPLKAMELPGLWNGAMAEWITLFVEVPIITFNPVKTVNDLLRKTHQPE